MRETDRQTGFNRQTNGGKSIKEKEIAHGKGLIKHYA